MRILFLLAWASIALAQTPLRLDPRWAEIEAASREKAAAAQRTAQSKQATDQAVVLAEKYKAVVDSLAVLAEAMDVFSEKYNASNGAVVLLKEERRVNEAMQGLVEAWKQLKRCDSWDVK